MTYGFGGSRPSARESFGTEPRFQPGDRVHVRHASPRYCGTIRQQIGRSREPNMYRVDWDNGTTSSMPETHMEAV